MADVLKVPVASVAVDTTKTGLTRFQFVIPPGRSSIEIFCGLKEFCTATAEVNGDAVVTFGRKLDDVKSAALVGELCQ